MRRILVSSARNASAVARSQTATKTASSPFICASCKRAAAFRTASAPNTADRRTFTTSIPRKQQSATAQTSQSQSQSQPQRESIAPRTHYDFFPETFPNGPPPHSPFTPDLRQLRKEFLQLQAKTHPDLAPSAQKRQAEALSMRLNEAYKAIQDPLSRARYLLSLRGIDVEDESAKIAENKLLMEVMMAREAVEEAESEDEVADLREINDQRIALSVAVLEKAFAEEDMQQAAEEAIRLRYWANIEESIVGWEKGKGGGILHH